MRKANAARIPNRLLPPTATAAAMAGTTAHATEAAAAETAAPGTAPEGAAAHAAKAAVEAARRGRVMRAAPPSTGLSLIHISEPTRRS